MYRRKNVAKIACGRNGRREPAFGTNAAGTIPWRAPRPSPAPLPRTGMRNRGDPGDPRLHRTGCFRIDDPGIYSAPEVPEVPVDVREGNRPDDVVRILFRSAVDEDRKRENASAARKIPGVPMNMGSDSPVPDRIR